ncbi:cytochrome P450 [Coemansia reversa NRRL 1564]|uniref:Cytochrome P450 n=1 Tax=Coemansia reversa (strain ATCC 12441 / NRRL 1564) TaxID=763665 RepID=A0A2G5BHI9_COERN|nr:cytochrome P450 [Coemansia reversa NRRL 1564]|eukprot:PIA18451.1 cytochrome P450 [Coemansia reversa NRRL 1564]
MSSYYNNLQFTGIENTVSTLDFEMANIRHWQMGPFFKPKKQLVDLAEKGKHNQCPADLLQAFIDAENSESKACLFKSLHLKPFTDGLLPRVSPKGGMVIQGNYILESTAIFINMAVTNHHSAYWDRPYEYDQTHFIENSEARHNVLTFSYGKRICLGQHLALWGMLTMLENILKNYDLQLPLDYTHLGPSVLNKHGYPRVTYIKQYIVAKPVNDERGCRLIITKAHATK